jgi:hypothetical protein
MSWIVAFSKIVPAGGGTAIGTLTFTCDDGRVVVNRFDLDPSTTPAFFKDFAARRIAWLDARDAVIASVSDGVVTPETAPPTIPPVSTPAELAKQAYSAKLSKLRQVRNAVTFGIVDADGAEQAALIAWLRTNFQVGYLDLFSGM